MIFGKCRHLPVFNVLFVAGQMLPQWSQKCNIVFWVDPFGLTNWLYILQPNTPPPLSSAAGNLDPVLYCPSTITLSATPSSSISSHHSAGTLTEILGILIFAEICIGDLEGLNHTKNRRIVFTFFPRYGHLLKYMIFQKNYVFVYIGISSFTNTLVLFHSFCFGASPKTTGSGETCVMGLCQNLFKRIGQ